MRLRVNERRTDDVSKSLCFVKPAFDMNALLLTHDLLWIVLDSLRYDVACDALAAGETPNLGKLIPEWEKRHTPATFTWPAHHAFFSGFLPTPVSKPREARLFAARFGGSETTSDRTFVFDQPYLVTALAARGFHTLTVGGVGFFNQKTEIGRLFPALFNDAHWSADMGPESPVSAEKQFEFAATRIAAASPDKPLFTFLNVAAIHTPNRCYRDTPGVDDLESHRAALRYVDRELPVLLNAVKARSRPTFFIIFSDHGTAYGENGYRGHRLAHEAVWTVPYAHGVL